MHYSSEVLCCITLLLKTLCPVWAASDVVTIIVNQALPLNFECSETESGSIVACGSLDSAVSYTTSLNQRPRNSKNLISTNRVSINLHNGTHYVTQQTNFGNTTVSFTGIDSEATIVCEYTAIKTSNSMRIHTWYFDAAEEVTMENIHFRGCGFPFRMYEVDRVSIRNCSFMHFEEAVLDIYNCRNVTFDRVRLQNNTGNGSLLEPLRGNSGGVAFGYNNLPMSYTSPTLTITDSYFGSNQALGFRPPEIAVAGQTYLGRGGGAAIYANESNHGLRVRITDCTFENNFARLFGGGLFFITTSYKTSQHIFEIEGCHFLSNRALLGGGGGVQVSFLSGGNVSLPHTFVFRDCLFGGNRGEAGGALYVFADSNGNLARLQRCNFTNNAGLGTPNDLGAAVAFSYLVRFTQRVTSVRSQIMNCSFEKNSGPNGVVSVGYTPVVFSGSSSFIENRGSSLRIIGSLVDLEGELEFRNNIAGEEGALYLISFGQIRLRRGTSIIFDGNIGRLGSSIVVDTLASITSFSDLLFNPRCFILYEDRRVPPLMWENVSILFRDNRATVSSAVYLSQRGGVCSWIKNTPPYFNSSLIPDWPVWSYENNQNTGFLDSQDQIYSFGTTAQEFYITSNSTAWPGQRVSVSLVGIDDFNHNTATSTSFLFQPNTFSAKNLSINSLQLEPQIVVLSDSQDSDGLLTNSFPLYYSVNSPDILTSPEDEPLGYVVAEEAFNTHPVVSDSLTLYAAPCPGGYNLTMDTNTGTMVCSCVTSSQDILFCEEDQESIVLKHGLWASFNPTNAANLNLYFHECPAGYCGCTFESSLIQNTSRVKECLYQYRHNDPDGQCVCERQGTLCGGCRDGLGVSVLRNMCVSCSDSFLTLIPLLVMPLVPVFLAIILIDKPIPDWSIPFLFYLQNVPYATSFFPETFESARQYVHYLSSATGFYFIYDFCLSSSLSTAHSYLLRFLPVFTAVLVFFAVWFVRRKVLKRKTLMNYGCWWCILLMFSSVTHTSMSSLHCPSIPNNGSSEIRWFDDGEMKCFTGAHLPLALLSILILIVAVFLVVFIALLPSMKYSLFKNYKEPLIASYKNKFSYWSGIELARRFLLLLALIYFPRNTVHATILLLISLSIYAYFFPYKSLVANILEVIVHLIFLLLLLLESTPALRSQLFVFSGDTLSDGCSNAFSQVSYIVILLTPIYYTPLVLFVGVAASYCILYIHRWRRSHHPVEKAAAEAICGDVRANNNYTTQSLDIDYSMSL